VTDANAVLGRINAQHPIGLKHLTQLDVAAARSAIGTLGERLSLDVEQTADAILTIVNHKMARRTRLLTVEQGHDPRDFALVVFGGAGPLHGSAIMHEVGIRTMLLPPHPGVLCALGCAVADIRYDLSQTVERPVSQLEQHFVHDVLLRQQAEGEARLGKSGAEIESAVVSYVAEMSYLGQIHTLRVPIDPSWNLVRIVEAFEAVYQQEYGNTLGQIPTVLVGLKTSVHGVRRKPAALPSSDIEARPAIARARRDVYFKKWMSTPIYDRRDLASGMVFDGPAIIEQADTTSVIEPGLHARVDAYNNILIEVL
jgi:N-methylhydantoinase A